MEGITYPPHSDVHSKKYKLVDFRVFAVLRPQKEGLEGEVTTQINFCSFEQVHVLVVLTKAMPDVI